MTIEWGIRRYSFNWNNPNRRLNSELFLLVQVQKRTTLIKSQTHSLDSVSQYWISNSNLYRAILSSSLWICKVCVCVCVSVCVEQGFAWNDDTCTCILLLHHDHDHDHELTKEWLHLWMRFNDIRCNAMDTKYRMKNEYLLIRIRIWIRVQK